MKTELVFWMCLFPGALDVTPTFSTNGVYQHAQTCPEFDVCKVYMACKSNQLTSSW